MGPPTPSLTLPWRLTTLASGFPVSNGACLGPNGVGYFGDWVDNKLFKFNYYNGSLIGTPLQLENFVFCTPALDANDRLFVTTDNQVGRLWRATPSTMTGDWFRTLGYWSGSPTLGPDGDVVGITLSGTAYRIDPNNNIVWSHSGFHETSPNNRSTTVFSRDDTKVFVTNGSWMTALNYSDGTIAWNNFYGSPVGAAATAQNGTVIFGTDNGVVHALDPNTGATRWVKVVGGEVRAAPGYSPGGGSVYVGSYDGNLYSFRVIDGHQNWAFPTTLWVNQSPVIGVDGRIYIHNKAGDLYSISSQGSEIWHVHLNGEARGAPTIGPDGTLYVGFTGFPDMGLAIIRQQPIDDNFATFTQVEGSRISGSLSSVFISDNDYLVTQARSFSSQTRTQYIFQGFAATFGLTQLWVWLEATATRAGVNQTVEFWDWNSSVWVQADSRESQTSDATAYVKAPGDFTRFIKSDTGQVNVRISFRSTAAFFGSTWRSKIDRLTLGTVPVFEP